MEKAAADDRDCVCPCYLFQRRLVFDRADGRPLKPSTNRSGTRRCLAASVSTRAVIFNSRTHASSLLWVLFLFLVCHVSLPSAAENVMTEQYQRCFDILTRGSGSGSGSGRDAPVGLLGDDEDVLCSPETPDNCQGKLYEDFYRCTKEVKRQLEPTPARLRLDVVKKEGYRSTMHNPAVITAISLCATLSVMIVVFVAMIAYYHRKYKCHSRQVRSTKDLSGSARHAYSGANNLTKVPV